MAKITIETGERRNSRGAGKLRRLALRVRQLEQHTAETLVFLLRQNLNLKQRATRLETEMSRVSDVLATMGTTLDMVEADELADEATIATLRQERDDARAALAAAEAADDPTAAQAAEDRLMALDARLKAISIPTVDVDNPTTPVGGGAPTVTTTGGPTGPVEPIGAEPNPGTPAVPNGGSGPVDNGNGGTPQ